MANAQTSTIQTQISQQREAIRQQEQQLTQAKQKSLQRPQQELRGIKQRNIRQQPRGGVLTRRIKRQAERGRFTKGLKQLSSQELKFEQEVATKSPEYGKEKFVQQAYEKVKPIYSQKISELDKGLKSYQDKLKEIKKDGISRNEKGAIDRIEKSIKQLTAQKSVYESYSKDPIKAIKGQTYKTADQEARFKSQEIANAYRRSEQKREAKAKFKEKYGVSYKDFSTRYSEGAKLDIITQAKMKDMGVDINKGIYSKDVEKAQQELMKEGVLKEVEIKPTEQAPVTSQVLQPEKVDFASSKLARDLDTQGTSTPFGVNYGVNIKPDTQYQKIKKAVIAPFALSAKGWTDIVKRTGEVDLGAIPRFGEKVGEVIQRPELLKEYIVKPKPEVVYSLTGGVVREPTKAELEPSKFVDPSTVVKLKEVPGRVVQTVAPAWEVAKDVTGQLLESKPIEYVRDIELAKGGTTEIYEPQFGTVQVDPMTGQQITGYKEIELDPLTVGSAALGVQTSLEKTGTFLGDTSARGWKFAGQQAYKYAETRPEGFTKDYFKGVGAVSTGISNVIKPVSVGLARATPYVASLGLGAGIDVLAQSEKIRPEQFEKAYESELNKQYSSYEKEYSQAQKNLEEGYELEPILSKEEFAKETELRKGLRSQITGEAVLPTLFLGGAAVGGALKGARYVFKDPLIIGRNGKLLLTTRGREIFGTKVSLPTKAGETLKFTRPQTGKYFDIGFQKLTPKTKGITPYFDMPSKGVDIGKTGFKYYDDVFGISRRVTPGQKTIVERGAKEFWWDLGRTKTPTRFYSGDPFSKLGRIERAKTLKAFEKLGIDKDWTKSILRLKRPEIVTDKFSGSLTTNRKLNILTGKTTSQFDREIVSGIKSRGGAGSVERITSISTPVKPIEQTRIFGYKFNRPIDLSVVGMDQRTLFIPGKAEGKLAFEMGSLQRETVKLTKTGLMKGPKITSEDFISTSVKLGKREFPARSLLGKETSLVKGKDFALKVTRKTPVLDLTPRPFIGEGDVYYGLSKTPKDISQARILLRKGAESSDDIFSVSGSGTDLKLVKDQKQITGQLTKVFKTKKVPKQVPELKLDKKVDITLAPLKIETKVQRATAIAISPETKQEIKEEVLIKQFQPQKDRQDTRSLSGINVSEIQKEEEKSRSGLTPIFRDFTRPDERVKIKPIEKVRVDTGLVTIQRPIQVSKTSNIFTPIRPRPRPEPERPKPPRPTKILPPNLEDPLKIKRRRPMRKKRREEFLAITKRRGREVVIGRFIDPLKAVQAGKQRVKRTLGATLKVRTTKGRQLQLTTSKEFRRSKTDPLAIVQKAPRRLGSLGERKEIKRARGLLA